MTGRRQDTTARSQPRRRAESAPGRGAGVRSEVAPDPAGGAPPPVNLRHDGSDRPYLAHVPASVGAAPPLLLELHGRGIDPVRFDRITRFRALADEEGFVLALPSGRGTIWNDGRDAAGIGLPDDVGYLVAVIDDARARWAIDPDRVYVVGMSNGAAMAGRLACERAECVTAFAQVAGTAAVRIAASAAPARSVPIIQIHGTADRVAPYAGGRRGGVAARLLIRRSFGPSIGVDDWARYWIAANDADPTPEISELASGVTARSWRGSSPLSDVVFCAVAGGGHTWPQSGLPLPRVLMGPTNTSFEASRAIWEFLARHARPHDAH